MASMQSTGYQGSEQVYQVPDLMLINQAGEQMSARSALNGDGPVMVNFIFTTCTTICPVMSATFAQVQESLGTDAGKVRMVSVSIDPEHDTPERLREYAKRFEAGPQWHFLTGSVDDSIAVQKSLGVYRGNKMSHEPTTLLKVGDDDRWFRMDGLASAADILAEYRRLIAR
jgi:protein SCO1